LTSEGAEITAHKIMGKTIILKKRQWSTSYRKVGRFTKNQLIGWAALECQNENRKTTSIVTYHNLTTKSTNNLRVNREYIRHSNDNIRIIYINSSS
jgi:hypothetical protein